MSQGPLEDGVREGARRSFGEFLKELDGLRPGLFRYCRRLTGNVWDAEDLVQDALEQGFARLASRNHRIENLRAYLLRIASNRWIDRVRRERTAAQALRDLGGDPAIAPGPQPDPDRGDDLREAGATLIERLAPRERAAVLLKEVFELSLVETALVLGTSEGAVKSALHRGRTRLRDSGSPRSARPPVTRAVLDRFVERYNARDLSGLLDTMLDTASIEMPGVDLEVGREEFSRKPGWFHYNLYNPVDGSVTDVTWETAIFEGDPVVLVLAPYEGGTVVTSVMCLETLEDRVSCIRVYAFCPDTVREVAAALGRRAAPLGAYRFHLAAFGTPLSERIS